MIMWWQFELVANAVISVGYLSISTPIAVPLVRTQQVRSNKLALATAVIFFSCSVGHGLHALEHVASIGRADHAAMTGSAGDWGLALWHPLTAAVGIYYLSLRGLYGRLLANPTTSDDLHEQQRGVRRHRGLRGVPAPECGGQVGATGLTALLRQVQEAVAGGAATLPEHQAMAAALEDESQRVVDALTSDRGPLARVRGGVTSTG